MAAAAPPQIVYPGDVVTLTQGVKTNIGHGLMQDGDSCTASKFGLLVKEDGKESNMVWVNNSQKMYLPRFEDVVVGTIIEKHGESYKIDIGTTHPAVLPSTAFEGATRRNKPNIQVGALMYARVVLANKHIDTELTCTSPHCKKDWVTNEALYGELKGGYCIEAPLDLCQTLLRDDCCVLQALGQYIPYELAVGVNGRVWVNSAAPLHTILVSNAILNSHNLPDDKIKAMVNRLVQSVQN